ncbi:MAG: dTDP-4-dehydrorhamnose reductase [Pseudomonadota bacterium]|nr:dTDP-4-dehydrorhamnose reductase [Pseudomonadota bacterium]
MKILLFGGTGQVGFELQRALAPVATLRVPGFEGHPRIDFCNFAELEKCVAQFAPDVVINAAGYTAVDKAESERDLATRINAEAPGVLAHAAAKVNAAIMHYSTDYVFDGEGHNYRGENESTAPLNHYGASKLAGEAAVVAKNPHHLIFRTSWVYAAHGKNFPKTILRLAANRDKLSVVADQMGAPTGAPLLADATTHALLALQRGKGSYGLYHLVASGETSWHELAMFLCDEALAQGLLTKVPELKPITSAEFPTPARRPFNSRLANEKFKTNFDLLLPHWKVGVSQLVRELAQARL